MQRHPAPHLHIAPPVISRQHLCQPGAHQYLRRHPRIRHLPVGQPRQPEDGGLALEQAQEEALWFLRERLRAVMQGPDFKIYLRYVGVSRVALTRQRPLANVQSIYSAIHGRKALQKLSLR